MEASEIAALTTNLLWLMQLARVQEPALELAKAATAAITPTTMMIMGIMEVQELELEQDQAKDLLQSQLAEIVAEHKWLDSPDENADIKVQYYRKNRLLF